MTANQILADFRARGVILESADDRLRFAPLDALTDEDIARLREHKADLLALLGATAGRAEAQAGQGEAQADERDPQRSQNEPEPFKREIHDRPRLGSLARPYTVRGARLAECPFHSCAGDVSARGRALCECRACGNWFRIEPMTDQIREMLDAQEPDGDRIVIQAKPPAREPEPLPADGICPGCLGALDYQGWDIHFCASCRRWFQPVADAEGVSRWTM